MPYIVCMNTSMLQNPALYNYLYDPDVLRSDCLLHMHSVHQLSACDGGLHSYYEWSLAHIKILNTMVNAHV